MLCRLKKILLSCIANALMKRRSLNFSCHLLSFSRGEQQVPGLSSQGWRKESLSVRLLRAVGKILIYQRLPGAAEARLGPELLQEEQRVCSLLLFLFGRGSEARNRNASSSRAAAPLNWGLTHSGRSQLKKMKEGHTAASSRQLAALGVLVPLPSWLPALVEV